MGSGNTHEQTQSNTCKLHNAKLRNRQWANTYAQKPRLDKKQVYTIHIKPNTWARTNKDQVFVTNN